AIAAVLALVAGELVLRRVHLQPAAWLFADEEPRRRPDPTLGWTLVPARAGRNTIGGRAIEYAIDAAGYRVRRVDEPVDRERPTSFARRSTSRARTRPRRSSSCRSSDTKTRLSVRCDRGSWTRTASRTFSW